MRERDDVAMLVAERCQVFATYRDCSAQVIGTDPNAPNAIAAGEIEIKAIPYKRIAGDLGSGHLLPTVEELAATHSVSVGTAHQAIALLIEEGLVAARRGA
ncbi:GntR family transcriptional regulator [Catenulispora rubra]|uniref:GntR family transcriptional regulator n=1 Tax=Catenulispora rubra TaxID=280293 RepID=UPI0018926845|nr:GntR family transcriptional regulator [Catenulispora rubra]